MEEVVCHYCHSEYDVEKSEYTGVLTDKRAYCAVCSAELFDWQSEGIEYDLYLTKARSAHLESHYRLDVTKARANELSYKIGEKLSFIPILNVFGNFYLEKIEELHYYVDYPMCQLTFKNLDNDIENPLVNSHY